MEEEKKIKWEDIEKGLNESEETKTYTRKTELENLTGRSSSGNLDLNPSDIKEMHDMLDQVIQEGGFVSMAYADESQGGIVSKIYINRKTEKQKEQMDRIFLMKMALRTVTREDKNNEFHPLVQYSLQLKDFIELSRAFAEYEMKVTSKLMNRAFENGDAEERALLESSIKNATIMLSEQKEKDEDDEKEDD